MPDVWQRAQNGAPVDLAAWSCPLPLRDSPAVVMGHGGGGALSAELVEHLFLPAFGDRVGELRDSAVVDVGPARVAFSTDSYVVRPLFFPGGSIGDLAVNGTVNDLAMSGARAALPVDGVHPRGGHAAGRSRPGRRRRWGARPGPRACCWSPATPRSSTRVTATAST